jgi:hypothetical protein
MTFTTTGAVTTFNPALVVKVHGLTVSCRCVPLLHSPGFELKESDTLWNWVHVFLEVEAIKAVKEYRRNVVRLRHEATNRYGTLEKAIEAGFPFEEYSSRAR